MGPGERNADDGHGEDDRGNKMRERQPPAGQQQPDQIADETERPGTDVGLAGQTIAAHGLLAERKHGVDGDIERSSRPRQTYDGDGHDDGGDNPGKRHPQPAEQQPEYVQKYRNRRHLISLKTGKAPKQSASVYKPFNMTTIARKGTNRNDFSLREFGIASCNEGRFSNR